MLLHQGAEAFTIWTTGRPRWTQCGKRFATPCYGKESVLIFLSVSLVLYGLMTFTCIASSCAGLALPEIARRISGWPAAAAIPSLLGRSFRPRRHLILAASWMARLRLDGLGLLVLVAGLVLDLYNGGIRVTSWFFPAARRARISARLFSSLPFRSWAAATVRSLFETSRPAVREMRLSYPASATGAARPNRQIADVI